MTPTISKSQVASTPVRLAQQAASQRVALLTGGSDRPYAFGLAKALLSKGVGLDFIGSDDLDFPELRAHSGFNFLNLRGSQTGTASLWRKVARILRYYVRLVRYASSARPQIFHVLWNNKFEFFDRTFLMLYYKLLRKRVVLTAHNVNAGRRDATDSILNRVTLRVQYRLADHIFVHTAKMRSELIRDFRIDNDRVTVIPFGINNAVPNTGLTAEQARQRLNICPGERTLLFFGHVVPYKGLEFLVAAFHRLAERAPDYRLIIAGQPGGQSGAYLADIQQAIDRHPSRQRVVQRTTFIPDEETELFFKAADLLVLPYTDVSQSGILVLGYSFGLPVVATDVGSLGEDIVEGRTGFLCKPSDPIDLVDAIERYFRSDLFTAPHRRHTIIREFASQRFSWDVVGQVTSMAYSRLIASC